MGKLLVIKRTPMLKMALERILSMISDKGYRILISVIALAAITIGFVMYDSARATINSFSIEPVIDATDNVAGYEGNYDISYTTNSTGIVSAITITFPSDFTVTTPTIRNFSGLIQSADAIGGNISINGTAVGVSDITASGQSYIVTLDTPFDYNSTPGTPDTVAFRILRQVTNTTVARVVDANEFAIADDAAGNSAEFAIAGFTVIPGPAFTLDFTTEPSMTTPPITGDIQSNTTWDVQPVVTAHDRFGNVATSYTGDTVVLSLASGDGELLIPVASSTLCSAPADAYAVVAVDGIIDFTGANLGYVASADHEQFTLSAAHLCGSNDRFLSGSGTSSTLTADVVADTYVWTTEPSGCASGSACTTQGIVEARDIVTINAIEYAATDIDFSDPIDLATDGAGTLLGTMTQSMVAGILNTTGIGYTLANPAISELISFSASKARVGSNYYASITAGATAAITITGSNPTFIPTPSPKLGGVIAVNPHDYPNPNNPILSATGTTIDRIQQTAALISDTSGSTGSSGFDGNNGSLSACTPYLREYLRLGALGDEVKKLQTFLSKEGSYSEGFITGYFGPLTEKAVKMFQTKYATDILLPQSLSAPTGFAKNYTQAVINSIVCNKQIPL